MRWIFNVGGKIEKLKLEDKISWKSKVFFVAVLITLICWFWGGWLHKYCQAVVRDMKLWHATVACEMLFEDEPFNMKIIIFLRSFLKHKSFPKKYYSGLTLIRNLVILVRLIIIKFSRKAFIENLFILV
jgi:hypothetical protein